MRKTKWVGLIAAICVSAGAHADLLNISTTSLQSNTEEAIACSIVARGGPTYEGYKVFVAYSEGLTAGSDPYLRVQSLHYDILYENDDWRGTQYLNGQVTFDSTDAENLATVYTVGLGRTPNNLKDSGLLMLSVPGDALCAHSVETQGSDLKRASVSITDVTHLFATRKAKSSGVSSGHKYLLDKLRRALPSD